MCVGHHYAQIT